MTQHRRRGRVGTTAPSRRSEATRIITKHLNLKTMLLVTTMLASPLMVTVPVPAMAQIAISVRIEPPVLPVYEQPPIPEPGYLWTPGYWAYADDPGYYWVPGTWVQPPQVNLLWTPPYWGWADGVYLFHDGYWGEHVGYYGGVNYGFGYGGSGYEGGRWESGRFAYNGTVNNFGSVQITNVYRSNVTVVNNSQVSFAGGPHGLATQPTAADRLAERDHHVPVTAAQASHITAAAKNPAFAAKQNGGHPAIAATARPAQFEGPGVVPAHGAVAEHAPAAARPDEHAAPGHEAPAERAAAHPVEHAAPAHSAPPEHVAQHPTPAARPAAAPVAHTAPHPGVAPAHAPPAEHAAAHPAPAAKSAPAKPEEKKP
jgi:hypothetical protein